MTMMKLLVQSKFSGAGTTGGGHSGGLSGLIGLVSLLSTSLYQMLKGIRPQSYPNDHSVLYSDKLWQCIVLVGNSDILESGYVVWAIYIMK